MKHIIIFTDCGDTLVDEATQDFIDRERCLVRSANLIDGVREELDALQAHGYRMAMVADGLVESFQNIISQHELAKYFETCIISEALDSQKPAPEMFRAAMDQMGLTDQDRSRIVMIGNNLERDIAGANRFGICSVLLSYSPRYPMQPRNADEIPDYTVSMPCEIFPLIEQLKKRYLETGKIY